MNERKNKFLNIGRNKGFISNPEDISTLTVKENNITKIIKSKKILIGSIVLGFVIIALTFVIL